MIQINAARRLIAAQGIYYRGLQETWNANRAKNQHLIFITPDRDYALQYAKDENHLLTYKATINHPFDFGFRTLTTSVSLAEVADRVRKGVMEQFKHGKVSKDKGLALHKEAQALGQSKSGHKAVWEWYMQVPELTRILKEAGFDAIRGNEGAGDDVETYGVFDHSQLHEVHT